MSEPQTITTERGTKFTVKGDQVTIVQHGQPTVTVHLDDLEGFFQQLLEEQGEDSDDEE